MTKRDRSSTRPRGLTPVPFKRLWMFRKADKFWSAELWDRGNWGMEVQIRRNGSLLISRRFSTRALAIEWADQEHTLLRTSISDEQEPPIPPDAA